MPITTREVISSKEFRKHGNISDGCSTGGRVEFRARYSGKHYAPAPFRFTIESFFDNQHCVLAGISQANQLVLTTLEQVNIITTLIIRSIILMQLILEVPPGNNLIKLVKVFD